jgi:hypothetical protein
MVIYAINVSTPGLLDRAGQIKGTDFSNFYVLGSLALSHDASVLYDRDALRQTASRLLPESSGSYYLPIYGPQVSLLFMPFALLPYSWALVIWSLISSAVYGVCCWTIWRACRSLRREGWMVLLLAAASPAYFNLIAHGQNSAIALACFTVAFVAIKRGKSFLAGLAIGTLVFKPQLGLVVAFVFVVNREWRVVAGALVAAMTQLGVTWLFWGTGVMLAYGKWIRGVGEITDLLWIKPYQMHSLSSFWALLLPWRNAATVAYAICAAITIASACWIWKSRAPVSLRFAFLLLATVLASPHLYVYDLVILTPALLMSADWALDHPDHSLSKPVQQAIYFSYALPAIGVASQFTRLQVSVIAMVALSAFVGVIAGRYSERWPFASVSRV